MITAATILAALQAGATAMAELFRFLQTPQGQAMVQKHLDDQAKFAAFVGQVGAEVDKFFDNTAKAIEQVFKVEK